MAVELSVVDEGAKAMAEVAMSAETATAKDFMVKVYGGDFTVATRGTSRRESKTVLYRCLCLATVVRGSLICS